MDLDKLGLNKVPDNQKNRIVREIGNLLVDEILRKVSGGNSPVKNRGRFKILDKEYANDEKFGNRNPNLDLDGDMLNSLTFRSRGSKIEVGIFDRSQVPKADGHNNFSGQSKLPVRRFIPNTNEKFDDDITSRVKKIIASAQDKSGEAKRATEESEELVSLLNTLEPAPITTTTSIDDLFGTSFIDQLLGGR